MLAAQYWVAYKKKYQLSTQNHTNWDRCAVFWDRSNCRQVVDPSANFDPTPVFGSKRIIDPRKLKQLLQTD